MLYSTILAGGSGTRLWPLSRACEPKFLHPLTATDRSLLQATVDRIGPLSDAGQIYVVTGTAHAAAISRQLPDVPAANILVEPSPRDSCAAVSLACAVLARRDPDAIMAAFSADHMIGDQPRFIEVIRQAAAAAEAGIDEKRKLADEVIDCSRTMEETQRQVKLVLGKLKQVAASERNLS